MPHDMERWHCQPYTDQSECIYWRTAMFTLVEDDIMTDPIPQESRSLVFELSYLSFQPPHACFHQQQVAKESASKTFRSAVS